MGYQSFPWASGSSQSYEKLRRLQLPSLRDKSFLDIGCNEGFFCGYAKFLGASKVVGVDKNPEFAGLARKIFPDCEFRCQSWDELGGEKYDVILNSSAIHYADDQRKFLDMLMERLAPGGMLVLEIGVAPGEGSRFVEVRRSIDTRFFPTREKLHEMLSPYAWKLISKSVPQAGDPIPREVYHISRRLPCAILLMDDPRAGKTYTSGHIFNPAIKKVSGDLLYKRVMAGEIAAPEEIEKIIRELGSNDWGRVTSTIFREGLGQKLCAWIGEYAGNEDFVFDMYIPKPIREFFAKWLEMDGYYVIDVRLQKALSRPRKNEMAPPDSCAAYMDFLKREYMVDEAAYLAAHPDVARAVAQGRLPSGQMHYVLFGKREGRRRG